jgi:diguanylate cyclase (GGDEF)-like protein
MLNRILFVDDDDFILETFRRTFRHYEAVLCNSPLKALELMKEESFDVVVSDYKMPQMDGVEFISRAAKLTPESVRIMLTGNADLEMAVKAVNEGEIFKFLQKPCDRNILKKVVDQAIDKFNSAKELKSSVDEHYYNASHDRLTGLPNRLLLEAHGEKLIENFKRYRRGFAVFFLDLDKFKPVNDTHGHQAGDAVLRYVSARLTEVIRGTDIAARVGGDEFVILAEGSGSDEAAEVVAGKLLAAIASPVPYKEKELSLGVSIGISLCPENGTDMNTLLAKADEAAYVSKRKGGNCWSRSKEDPSAC